MEDVSKAVSLDGEFDPMVRPEGAEPGLCCCVCGTVWCRVGGLKRLADVQCPKCGATYADVGWNVEP